jgi:nicotinamide mononucleotide (NMN) deamidase PncC
MADGVRKVSGAQLGISTTGIAGPAGGTPEKPVGLVYVAVAYQPPQGSLQLVCEKYNFPGDRRMNKERSAQAVLNLVRKVLIQHRFPV